MIAVTPRGERTYILSDDLVLPVEQQTHFRIRDLTERERVKLQDSIMWKVDEESGAVSATTGTKVNLTLRMALVGTTKENPIRMEDGSEVESPDVMDDEYLSLLPWGAKEELCMAIHQGLVMTEEEVEKPEPSLSDS